MTVEYDEHTGSMKTVRRNDTGRIITDKLTHGSFKNLTLLAAQLTHGGQNALPD